MKKPPLHIHLLFHPDSETARELANALAKEWMGRPALQGLRVPVFFAAEDGSKQPQPIEVDAAEHSIMVLLIDSRMTRRVKSEGEAWSAFARNLCREHRAGGRHLAFPVALDGSAFDLDQELAAKHFLNLRSIEDPDQRLARLSFTVAVRALQLLGDAAPSTLEAPPSAPIQIFVSHAKRDLDKKRLDPVGFVQRARDELPIDDWFDARFILEGDDFEKKIKDGLKGSHSVLIFLTDAWATRRWCRWEALAAKELGKPIVVIDALHEGEPRSFPYGGNVRLLRWQPPIKPPAGAAAREAWREESQIEGERMLAAAVREALRLAHAGKRLEGMKRKDDVVLDIAPEAARLSWQPPTATFLYPDPPIGREERDLLKRIWPDVSFETPIMRLVQQAAFAPPGKGLAVSVSESHNLAQRGLSSRHERLLTDEIHLYLLLAGFQIHYGGKLDPDHLDDPDNFTLRLFQLARDYGQLAEEAGAQLALIHNVAPWPLWKLYDDNVLDLFGNIADIDEVPLPDFGVSEEELGANERGFVPPVQPLQLYAWSRALTAMREKVTEQTVARLCIGGKLEGYKGRLAGLIEEPLLSLRAKKPLFLVGALGGCTELVIDLLEGRDRPEMSEEVAEQNVARHQEILALYDKHGGEKLLRDQVAAEIKTFGSSGPEKALRNGLDDEENRELFATADPHRVATLVLTGLERLHSSESR